MESDKKTNIAAILKNPYKKYRARNTFLRYLVRDGMTDEHDEFF